MLGKGRKTEDPNYDLGMKAGEKDAIHLEKMKAVEALYPFWDHSYLQPQVLAQ